MHQQHQQVAGTEADLAMLAGQVDIVANRLALLLGRAPDPAALLASDPGMPALPERPLAAPPRPSSNTAPTSAPCSAESRPPTDG